MAYKTDAEVTALAAAQVGIHTGDATDAHDASAISFDGTASSSPEVNVQDELDRLEGLVGGGGVTSFESRTGAVTSAAGDYTASEVTFVPPTPTGPITGTNVQQAMLDTIYGSMPGVVRLDDPDFTGATDDDKLTNAINFAMAQTHVPWVMLEPRAMDFNLTRAAVGGLRVCAPSFDPGTKNTALGDTHANHECRMGAAITTGASSWWVATGSQYGGKIFGLNVTDTNWTAQFMHAGAGANLYSWNFDSLSFFGMRHMFGNTSTNCFLTQCVFTGHWQVGDIINAGATGFHMGGSDNQFWVDGMLNIGGSGASGDSYLVHLDGMAKTHIGKLYLNVKGGYKGLFINGTAFTHSLYIDAPVIEGISPTADQAHGALIRITGGGVTIRDPFLGQYMENPNSNGSTNDLGAVVITGGDVVIERPTFQLTDSVTPATPAIYVSGTGKVKVTEAATAEAQAGANPWTTFKPLVQNAGTGVVSVDGSVDVIGNGPNTVTRGQTGRMGPESHGLLAWAYDIVSANQSSTVTAGTQYCTRLRVGAGQSITNIHLAIGTAGSGLTSGQNFAMVYDSALNWLGTTADQTTPWATAGAQNMAIAGGPVTCPTEDCLVMWYANGSTTPAFSRSLNNGASNINLSTANSRFATSSTGRTTAPATPTAAALAASITSYWAAVS